MTTDKKNDDRGRILVVDDSPGSLKLLTEILTTHGFMVRPAPSGRLAIRSAGVEVPDLILLDVIMPDQDGYEVCRQLKADERTASVPVIFISSLEESADKIKGFQVGGVDFISKPFEPEEILARVKTHLSLHRLQKQLEAQNLLLEEQIIEREQKEEELKDYQENLEQMVRERTDEIDRFFALNLDLLCVLTEDGAFLKLNPAWESTLGYQMSDLLSKSYLDLIHPDDLEVTRHAGKPVVSDHISNFVNRYRHCDGSYRWLEWSSIHSGNRIFASARDITERKNTETSLTAARKKLNLLNSVVFSDIQNYIFSLTGFIDLHGELVTDSKQLYYLENERSAVKKVMLSLNFAKMYQDMGIRPPVWHQVSQTFLFAISHLDFSRYTREIRVEGLEIYADPLLEKVFLIFAENVIAYAPDATTVRLWYDLTSDGCILFFEDDGPGILPEVKEQIFEQWYGEQKGMGLFLSREILAITGLSIREKGESGSGARFEIVIPKGAFRLISPG
ncbi:MAG: response regulator [Methanospirillum sp.]|uniref:response regulator n=1 Tax=Methanospirillum sp. TaxID=45200 RepID=UPI00236BB94E|nr:response regulator [Methanospirillum sp.]MDD1730524.1 response regulator [Methanospirillum sp.]